MGINIRNNFKVVFLQAWTPFLQRKLINNYWKEIWRKVTARLLASDEVTFHDASLRNKICLSNIYKKEPSKLVRHDGIMVVSVVRHDSAMVASVVRHDSGKCCVTLWCMVMSVVRHDY